MHERAAFEAPVNTVAGPAGRRCTSRLVATAPETLLAWLRHTEPGGSA